MIDGGRSRHQDRSLTPRKSAFVRRSRASVWVRCPRWSVLPLESVNRPKSLRTNRQCHSPPSLLEHDLSTLIQQILSVLAETGGIVASALFGQLSGRGAFQWLDAGCFA